MSAILFIDDDLDILEINARYFKKEGHDVKTVANPKEALHLLKTFSPDCIVLDIMMPGQNGFETCRQIRNTTNVPIIFLSGRTEENDKIKGLMTGADDYMEKPYSFRELSTRIQAHIRRNIILNKSNLINCPPLSLNLATHKAYYNCNEIVLSNREFELLYLLLSNARNVVTFEEIGRHMWGTCTKSDRKSIVVTTSRLRNKLETYSDLAGRLESVRSHGYIFNL